MKIQKKHIGCFLIVLVTLFILNALTVRIGYRFPGGEIDFIGLSKTQVIETIFRKNLIKDVAVEGNNHRSFNTFKEALNERWIMKSNKWGVNRRIVGMMIYSQILYFNKEDKVYKQSVEYLRDGP